MKLCKTLFAVVVSSFALVACGDTAALQVSPSEAQGTEALSRQTDEMNAVLSASAHEYTAAEISRLALHRSKNAMVLAYAEASFKAHQEAYRELRKIAEPLKLRVSRMMSLEGQKQWGALFAHGSGTFDAAYKETLDALQTRGIEHTQAVTHATDKASLTAWAAKVEALYHSEQEGRAQLP